jgi:hypothetical protein
LHDQDPHYIIARKTFLVSIEFVILILNTILRLSFGLITYPCVSIRLLSIDYVLYPLFRAPSLTCASS